MKFKSNIIKSAIGAAILEIILGGIIYLIVNIYTSFNPRYALIIIIIVGVLFAILSIKANHTVVELFDDRLTIKLGGNPVRTINFKDYDISSYVVNHSYNGIQVSTERLMRLHDGENLEEIRLHNFSKKAFEKIFSHIGKSNIDKEEVLDILVGREFFVPKKEMLNNHMKFLKGFILIASLGMLVLSVVLVLLVEKSNMPTGEVIFLFGAGFFPFTLLMVGGIGGAIYLEYRKKNKKTPYKITIDKDYLVIDGEKIFMSTIEKILATPPEYGIGTWKNSRDMTITFRNKKGIKRLYFGVRTKGWANKTTFEEYEEMCQILHQFSVINNVEFIYDL